MQKNKYAAPKLVAHGKLEDLTHANAPVTNQLDATFSASSSTGSLTFT